jgi:hypothetical protein
VRSCSPERIDSLRFDVGSRVTPVSTSWQCAHVCMYRTLRVGCWKWTYGRGAGILPATCPPGMIQEAGLCYQSCNTGYTGIGPVCWQDCSTGFTDIGVTCQKPESYGRGVGALFEWACSGSYGCEQYGGLWYPRCHPGYSAFGCCVCSPDCTGGMADGGADCRKNTYTVGPGISLVWLHRIRARLLAVELPARLSGLWSTVRKIMRDTNCGDVGRFC